MRILPVLDLKGGLVVRGIAGRRQEYRPIESRLTSSPLPLDVAEAFRTHFGLTHLYLADLDAIAGFPPAMSVFRELTDLGFCLWVDAGIRDEQGVEPLAGGGVIGIVAGLETIRGPAFLENLLHHFGQEGVVFSLDLKNGEPLGDATPWDGSDAESIASQAVRMGVRHLIVLDLARVGMGGGIGTEDLCRRLATAHPKVEIIAGGGVRDAADLKRLRDTGIGGVLVASALHDGRIRREDLDYASSR